MILAYTYKFTEYENEVKAICGDFLKQRGLSYFHYSRNYSDGSRTVLTSNICFLKDFLCSDPIAIKDLTPLSVQQCLVYFWDGCISEKMRNLIETKHNLYHGIAIVNRFKNYYDCASFAMPQRHPHPNSFYMRIVHDLKSFSQIFPKMAQSLLKKVEKDRLHLPKRKQDRSLDAMLLPRRSERIQVAPDGENYVTTLELFCVKLFNEGKSYKEIGEILSISHRTVETHLGRMKRRTGLTFGEIALKSFKMIPKPENTKSVTNFKNSYS